MDKLNDYFTLYLLRERYGLEFDLPEDYPEIMSLAACVARNEKYVEAIETLRPLYRDNLFPDDFLDKSWVAATANIELAKEMLEDERTRINGCID